ncbi:coiled-coil domain-containing protein 189 [Aplysia californica]|uniref:Coiled-coil domain-containing protein 189 n=1 Tax=Aplysia californica TaxID=6500 RepID=A0ABM1A1N0_APLCA|nr:coiled-coil domain-containing protein 189 [Aplysia californica]
MILTDVQKTVEEPADKVPKINQPKRHKAKIAVWADLSVDAVDRLNESLNADHIKQVLADIFMLDNYKDSLKIGIIMDLYYYTLQYARQQSFSPEKTSAFFSIIKKVFEVCIETPFGNLDHTFEYFKDLIHCHSVNRPPYSIELFTPDEVRKITEYTINTFFRHFKMYKYAFTPMVRLDLAISYVGMPPSPPPSEADGQDAETTPGGDETPQNDDAKEEEIDEERQAAREELKSIVKNFLTTESKKIEGSVDQQVKTAVEALNNKIDQITDAAPKAEGKGKKK